MRKICFVAIILSLFICSCSANQKTNSNTPANANQAASAKSDSGSVNNESSKSQWPAEFEGKLPKPDCKITDVIRYDEKSMSGKLTIAKFSDMSKENAEKYVKELKDMGFSGGMEIHNDQKILFSGVGKDASAKNGINFDYDISAKTGSISY